MSVNSAPATRPGKQGGLPIGSLTKTGSDRNLQVGTGGLGPPRLRPAVKQGPPARITKRPEVAAAATASRDLAAGRQGLAVAAKSLSSTATQVTRSTPSRRLPQQSYQQLTRSTPAEGGRPTPWRQQNKVGETTSPTASVEIPAAGQTRSPTASAQFPAAGQTKSPTASAQIPAAAEESSRTELPEAAAGGVLADGLLSSLLKPTPRAALAEAQRQEKRQEEELEERKRLSAQRLLSGKGSPTAVEKQRQEQANRQEEGLAQAKQAAQRKPPGISSNASNLSAAANPWTHRWEESPTERKQSLSPQSLQGKDSPVASPKSRLQAWQGKKRREEPTPRRAEQPLKEPLLATAAAANATGGEAEQKDLEANVPVNTSTAKTCLICVAFAILKVSCLLLLFIGAAAIYISALSVDKAGSAVAMDADANIGAGARVDYALRPSINPLYCVGTDSLKGGANVLLKPCNVAASQTQHLVLARDSTLRFKAKPNLCVTAPTAGGLVVAECNASSRQVWDFRPGGRLGLKSEQGQCINVLGGLSAASTDLPDAQLGLYTCGSSEAPMNEVFVYGAGNAFIADLEDNMRGIAVSVDAMRPSEGATGWAAEMTGFLDNLKVGNQTDAYVKSMGQWASTRLASLQQSSGWSTQLFFDAALATAGVFTCVATLALFAIQRRKDLDYCAGCSPSASTKLIIVMAASLCACLFFISWSLNSIREEASVHIPDLDHRLRMAAYPDYCLTPGGAEAASQVKMQSCTHANANQEFQMMIDGTIRLRDHRGLCLSRQDTVLVLQACGESSFQTFETRPGSVSLILKDTNPPLCVNLLGGDIMDGSLGFYACYNDPNEVFVYSGGNAVMAALQSAFNEIQTGWVLKILRLPLQMVRFSGIFLSLGVLLPALWMSLACGRSKKVETSS